MKLDVLPSGQLCAAARPAKDPRRLDGVDKLAIGPAIPIHNRLPPFGVRAKTFQNLHWMSIHCLSLPGRLRPADDT
jgi:hypothetical protein